MEEAAGDDPHTVGLGDTDEGAVSTGSQHGAEAGDGSREKGECYPV